MIILLETRFYLSKYVVLPKNSTFFVRLIEIHV